MNNLRNRGKNTADQASGHSGNGPKFASGKTDKTGGLGPKNPKLGANQTPQKTKS